LFVNFYFFLYLGGGLAKKNFLKIQSDDLSVHRKKFGSKLRHSFKVFISSEVGNILSKLVEFWYSSSFHTILLWINDFFGFFRRFRKTAPPQKKISFNLFIK
jgi:hypothetical protein